MVQYLSVEHTNTSTPDDPVSLAASAVQVQVSFTDGDNDPVTTSLNIGSQIRFEDDGPTAPTLTLNAAGAVTHDETAGLQNSGVAVGQEDNNDNDVAGPLSVFANITAANGTTPGDDPDVAGTGPLGFATGATPVVTLSGGSFGADGPGATPTAYALHVTDGTFSGVRTTAGVDIFLFNGTGANLGLILGRIGTEASATPGSDNVNPAGNVAFALSIDPTGVVSVVQYLSVEHTNTSTPDDPVSLAASAVQVQVSFTDGDNDPVTTSLNIGSQIRFEDDGPTAPTLTLNAAGAVTHDETAGLQNSGVAVGQEDNNDNDVAGPLSVFANITAANGTTPGDDPDVAGTGPLGFATGATPVVTLSGGSFGADGPGATPTAYALHVTDGTFSGVRTTAGVDIFLFNGTGANLGLILGRIGTEASATPGSDNVNPAGNVAFALSIDPTGVVSVVQYLSVEHTNTSTPDDPVSLAASAVQVQVSFTDGDNDPVTTSLNIGSQIRFEDDIPIAAPATNSGQAVLTQDTNLLITLDISGSMNDPANFGGLTRLELAKQSILELFAQYSALGNVHVELVTFSTTATNATGTWVDLATAKNILLNLTADGTTNYDDALNTTWNAFVADGGVHKIPGAQNVEYFLSDGVPNASTISGSPNNGFGGDSGISGTETTAWQGFPRRQPHRFLRLGHGLGCGPIGTESDRLQRDPAGRVAGKGY